MILKTKRISHLKIRSICPRSSNTINLSPRKTMEKEKIRRSRKYLICLLATNHLLS
jgi:hypothetical protein